MEELTYVMRQGQYEQYRAPVEIDGPRSYSGIVNYDTMHIGADMNSTEGQGYAYLMKEFNFNFPGEYADLHPEDLQYTSAGEPYGDRPLRPADRAVYGLFYQYPSAPLLDAHDLYVFHR